MERITLSRNEKEVLRMIAGGQGICPAEYPLHTFNAAVRSLAGKGLVQGAYEEGSNVADAMLTQVGRQYLAENPNLRNPINWGRLATLIAAVSVGVSVVAMLIACNGI